MFDRCPLDVRWILDRSLRLEEDWKVEGGLGEDCRRIEGGLGVLEMTESRETMFYRFASFPN